ncbi:arylformamidase [Bacillus horti]|uniref:Kynurenine formamidase n=1 Tax=Caldalkalibacillus horti TaxID=77523 RepID=A0ABT9W3E7_9BACI|nr:arylformamidase [Bacillus horti]MDQ0167645.1 arylformamidase [Bacillus horti]
MSNGSHSTSQSNFEQGWIDISQPLSNKLAHWPGDTSFSYTFATKEQTGSVNVGRMTTSLHSGTHVDAPFHFLNEGAKIHELDLNLYIGPCRLIDIGDSEFINADALSSHDLNGVTRLLIRTKLPNNPNSFPDSIPHFTKDGAAYLGEKGIRLVGLDCPSVDALDSKELEGHHALHQNGVHILENVMLDQLSLGDYLLIALPLAIQDGDGSPVRAVVKPL